MQFENQKIIFKICLLYFLMFGVVGALEDHKINLKIGFDLIPNADGSPSIRIRDFEDFNLRKFGRRSEQPSIVVRADDSSSMAEENAEDAKKSDEAVHSSESVEKALRSTKGINPDEFEPETIARVHSQGKTSDTESEER